jgi:hypothetical protein
MAAQPTVVDPSPVCDAPDRNNGSPLPLAVTPVHSRKEPIARQKPKYKSTTHASKTIPYGRFRRIVKEIETVLLEISVDGTVSFNPLELRPAIPTLNAWADHLRSALKELTK